MEEDYKRILDRHRDKFRQAVNIERLSSSLLISHILSESDWQIIEAEIGSQRVDRLLDLLKTKGYDKFKRFCVILETTYPYMLNCMFLGMDPPKDLYSGIQILFTSNLMKMMSGKSANGFVLSFCLRFVCKFALGEVVSTYYIVAHISDDFKFHLGDFVYIQ
jgi:hypothetical protein